MNRISLPRLASVSAQPGLPAGHRLSALRSLPALVGLCALLGVGAPSVAATEPARTTTAQPPARTAANKAKPDTAAATKKPAAGRIKQKPGEVMELDWKELLPRDERKHYSAAAPPPLHGPLGEGGPPAVQQQTTTVNEELGGINVHLPGFVVPIGTPRDGLIREFFLVPYVGACIHVPPPPPNQMVFVTSASGISADAIHEAYWVTGKIRLENRTTSLGNAAYALNASKVELYQY
jgi:uncharacterized protein